MKKSLRMGLCALGVVLACAVQGTSPYDLYTTGAGYNFDNFETEFSKASQPYSPYVQPHTYYTTSQHPYQYQYDYPKQEPQHTPYTGYGADYYSSLPGFQDYGHEYGGLSSPAPRPPPSCNKASKYRTIDGSCNNLKNPLWGSTNTPYGRLLPAKYSDRKSQPPVSVSGKPLPNSRQLSLAMFPDVEVSDHIWSLAAMQWGQIIVHDMSLAAGATQGPAHATKCCKPSGQSPISEEIRDRSCYPIMVPKDDPLVKKFGRGCMEFVRTMTTTGQQHKGGAAEQVVAVTHWMDASMVYGSTDQVAQSLRARQGGKLRVEVRAGKAWPPTNQNKTLCEGQNVRFSCYLTGDVRANQNPQLTVFQVQLLREHNRLAHGLQKINPHWDDERLYQEARRILIAEVQHISYYEWLPIFLGRDTLLRHGVLYNAHNSYVNDYNDKIDPSVLNGHATAAFRYFHTNIQGLLNLVTDSRYNAGSLRLSDYFNKPGIIEDGTNFDDLTRGMATQPQHATDRYHTSEITDFLFRDKQPVGSDLKAIDIHRGRDHGLASYNAYRSFCGLHKAADFSHFSDAIDAAVVQQLKKYYSHVEDVDLSVAGSLERHVPGTLSGPTFLCIMVEQFYRTRVADRHFFENGKTEGAFTPAQLTEVRKSSIARIMCDNSDDIYTMQPRGFEKLSKSNPLVPCDDHDSLPSVNLAAWKDKPSGQYSPYFDHKK